MTHNRFRLAAKTDATGKWKEVPLDAEEAKLDIAVPQNPRDLETEDLCAVAIGGALLAVGGCWAMLPWQIRRRRQKQEKKNLEQGLQQRRDMSRESERNNVSRRLAYHVARVPPMREDAAADTAVMLGRLFGSVQGERLDLDRTIDAEFAALTGGRAYFPRFEGEMPELFGDISNDIRNQYTLSYSPSNTKLDGTYRKLKVEVIAPDGGQLKVKDQKGKDHKIEVVSREGYTAKHTVE